MPDTAGFIKMRGSYGNNKPIVFSFRGGGGTFRHEKMSCSDADLKKAVLKYKEGTITIRHLLNPSFFEYDLDRDGEPEQFIISSRNCTQELTILRFL